MWLRHWFSERKNGKNFENVRFSFSSIRTGRASPAMLDKVEVEYYGTPVSLKSIAQISTPNSSSLMVQPYDKSCLKEIEKTIVSSHLGLTPNNDGEVIRLTLPQLTAESTKELLKVVAEQAEEGKVAIRNIRRDAIKSYEKLEKDKKLSEDNVKDLSGDMQVPRLVDFRPKFLTSFRNFGVSVFSVFVHFWLVRWLEIE
ncbi:ribosome-recycling factor, chloroplastic-like [Primulina huaijiensis]|uniref:ribosome-recycling factor, chloroplastic-like n=1 Tax=Primulina huaijiensis TaxID=1492673 RepID=UPI003CC79579